MMMHPNSPRRRGWPEAACLAVLLAIAPVPAVAADDDDDDSGGACGVTARLMLTACGHETADDWYVAKAKCLNVADASRRAACVEDAREARAESVETCRAQYESRRAACARLGEARYDPPLDPALFDADFRHLSNPNLYFPLAIGNKWEYRGGDERTTVEVLAATKSIAGLTCIVVRDLVYEGGRLKEATDDWFAAARDGSTWYCGEEAKDYEWSEGDRPPRAELVSIDGSFKHGRDWDKAGLIMPAAPRPGWIWREEFSLGNAEDVAEVVSTTYGWRNGSALDRHVPRELAQRFCGNNDCVVTKNWSLLEPDSYELKYHARGIGLILEIKSGEGLALQLVGCNFDARCVALPAP